MPAIAVADTLYGARSDGCPSPARDGRAQRQPAEPYPGAAPSRSTVRLALTPTCDSPGASPEATAGAHPRRDLHPYPGDGAFPALAGRRVRHRLTPTDGACTPTDRLEWSHWATHRPLVGARRCLARRARGAADAWRPSPPLDLHPSTGPPTRSLPALPGRRVRPRLTPTRRARSLPDTPARHRGARYAQPTPHRCRRHGRGVGFPHAPADRHDCWPLVQVHCPVETSQAVLSFSLPSGAPQSALSASASGTTNSQTVCFSYCGGCPFTGLTGRSL
jgi:hypothetical protein